MIQALFPSVLVLMMSGLASLAIFCGLRYADFPKTTRLAFGALMGVAAALVGRLGTAPDAGVVAVAAATGPLVFAGYLGGPVGALAAVTVPAAQFVAHPDFGGALSMLVLSAVAGLGIRYLIPPQPWPAVTARAIWGMMGAFTVAVAGHVLLIPIFAPGLDPADQIALGRTLVPIGIGSFAVLALCIHAASRMVTEQKVKQRAGLWFETLTETGRFGVFEWVSGAQTIQYDAGSRNLYNRNADLSGISVEDWMAMIVPEDRDRVAEHVRRTWAGEPGDDWIEFRIRRQDGTCRMIRLLHVLEHDEEGALARIVGIQEDTTEQHDVERDRRLIEARLKNIVENLPGAVMSRDITDPHDPKITLVTRQSKEILGYSPEELINDPEILDRVREPAEVRAMRRALVGVTKDLKTIVRRFQVTTRQGEKKWIQSHTGALRMEDGSIHADGIYFDVTDQVRTEEELKQQIHIAVQAQKREGIGQLTGGVAHDFNNLLAVVMGNLELLRDSQSEPDQIRLIESSLTATRRGADLTRNMLAFARKARLEPDVLDLNRLVNVTRNWAGRTLPATISVETSLLAGLWPIEADPSSTESALLNLILNARDAMPSGGKLTIETANVRIDDAYIETRQENLDPGRYVMLAVSDTGEGIPAECVDKIFEPFFTTKPVGLGSGLGLSMVQGFMQQSGGAVRFYSEVGVGTTFKLYFKALSQPGGRARGPAAYDRVRARDDVTQTARLLVAEDEGEVLKVLVETLERAGFDVTPTASGDEARAAFEADPTFDLLLTDIVMPGSLQGTALSKVLRQIVPDLPVVFMSGYAAEATVHGNGLRPEDIRLMKPVTRADLIAAIQKSLKATGRGG